MTFFFFCQFCSLTSTISARWYTIAYQTTISLRHDDTLYHTRTKIFMWGGKRLLFENSINQILVKLLKLYSCHFIVTYILLPSFKVALTFYSFYTNPLVWFGCQGKQSASSELVNSQSYMDCSVSLKIKIQNGTFLALRLPMLFIQMFNLTWYGQVGFSFVLCMFKNVYCGWGCFACKQQEIILSDFYTEFNVHSN